MTRRTKSERKLYDILSSATDDLHMAGCSLYCNVIASARHTDPKRGKIKWAITC